MMPIFPPADPIPIPEPDIIRPPTPAEQPEPNTPTGIPQPGPDVVVPPAPPMTTPAPDEPPMPAPTY